MTLAVECNVKQQINLNLSDNLKGTESWRLLVWVTRLRSGVFEGVSDLLNFINEKRTKSVNDFSSTKDGRTVVFDRLNILFSACHSFLPSPQFSLTRSW